MLPSPNSIAAVSLATPCILNSGCLPKGVDLGASVTLTLLTNGSETAKGVYFLFSWPAGSWQLAFCCFLSLSVTFLIYSNRRTFHHKSSLGGVGEKCQDVAAKTSLVPLLLPCRTTHTRIFPRKHSFSYSYLFVGIPIGWQGSAGSLLSADMKLPNNKWGKSTWFSVDSADYLQRGNGAQGLRGKLDDYLRTQVCRRLFTSFLHHIKLYLG